MNKTMKVAFPGGVRADVTVGGHTIRTDQPVEYGGEDSAADPFDLFLASLAACAGFYALRFCQARDLPPDGLQVTLDTVQDPESKLHSHLRIGIRLPDGFPEKYHGPIMRAVNACSVKKHLANPPEIEVSVSNA
jgi:ribosomal protein S12 methylthiotransferase accessory factor